MNKYAHWFRWFVVLGILQDWFFALPGMFIPNAVLGAAHTAPALRPVWVAYACLLLALLSLCYIPAAIDPLRNVPLAVLTVLARVAGVLLFFVVYPGQFPPLFGYIDLTLAVLQGGALCLALRSQSATTAP
jgi:hypothetical protein